MTTAEHALGLGHFTFLDYDPTSLIRLARAAGFDHVGLRFHPVAAGELDYLPRATGEMAEIRDALDGEGVALFDVEVVVMEDGLDPLTLRPMMDAAAGLGAQRINVSGEDADRAATIDLFARICALAEERGLSVDLECMAWRGIGSPEDCEEIIAASGAANAGYLLDALHHDRCGGRADLSGLDPRIVEAVQICDAPAARPREAANLIAEARGGRMIPGEGGLDLKTLIAALPADAVLSVEIPMAGDPRPPLTRARAIAEATRALIRGEA